jgi:hypothetical protein
MCVQNPAQKAAPDHAPRCRHCVQEGWIEPGTFHYALLSGLHPGHRYHYRFGSDADGFSDDFSFLAPPKHGPNHEVRILAMADMGQSEPDGSDEEEEEARSQFEQLVALSCCPSAPQLLHCCILM